GERIIHTAYRPAFGITHIGHRFFHLADVAHGGCRPRGDIDKLAVADRHDAWMRGAWHLGAPEKNTLVESIHHSSSHLPAPSDADAPAELVLDMHANDLIERTLGGKTERLC